MSIEELRNLVVDCAKFLLSHNAKLDAVDLLDELEIAGGLAEVVDENTYARMCAYMLRCMYRKSILRPTSSVNFLHYRVVV